MPTFITPPELPGGTVSRKFEIPASKEWLGVISEALSQTIYAHNFQQIDPAAMTPQEAAEAAYAVYEAWLLAAEALGQVLPPDDGPVYRRNPDNGHFEKLVDNEWVEPTGDEAIPEPAARAEPTDDEKKCAAATNLEHVLHLLWDEVYTLFQDGVLPSVAYVQMATEAGTLLGAAFYPPLIAVAKVETIFFSLLYGLMNAIVSDNWDAEFSTKLKCLFKSKASIVGGKVTFDLAGIEEQLWTDAFTFKTWITQAMQLQYFLFIIGQQGIDRAGGLTAVAGDCNCGVWAREFDFSLGNGNWTASSAGDAGSWQTAGYWQSVAGVNTQLIDRVDNPVNSGFTITRVYIEYWLSVLSWGEARIGTYGPTRYIDLPQSAINTWLTYDSGYVLNWAGATEVMNRFFRGGGGQSCRVRKVRVWGTGTMPFAVYQGAPYYGS